MLKSIPLRLMRVTKPVGMASVFLILLWDSVVLCLSLLHFIWFCQQRFFYSQWSFVLQIEWFKFGFWPSACLWAGRNPELMRLSVSLICVTSLSITYVSTCCWFIQLHGIHVSWEERNVWICIALKKGRKKVFACLVLWQTCDVTLRAAIVFGTCRQGSL